MKGVRKFERVDRAKASGAFTDRDRHCQNVNVRVAEKGPVASLQTGIPLLERRDETFGPGQIANCQLVACRAQGGDSCYHLREPGRVVLQEIDDAVRVEVHLHGRDSSGGGFLVRLSSWSRSSVCWCSSHSSRARLT